MKLNKKQKRTATIASMAALLAVVLGMGGQTFAKYISTQDAAATATVAKWGLVANVNASQMISGATSSEVDTSINGDTVAVTTYSGIVYPGQSGKLTFSVTGYAEVTAKKTFNFIGEWKDVALISGGVSVYNPIKWTLTRTGDIAETTTGTLEEIKTKLSTNASETIAPSTESKNDTYELSWNWPIEANNQYDTYLGNLAAGLTKSTYGDEVELASFSASNLEFSLGLQISIEQA